MKLSKEFKVGFLVLTTGLIFYFGFNYLKGNNMFSSTQFFTAVFPDAQSLLPTNPVTLNGVGVGRVESLKFLHDRGDSVEVTISVKEEFKISRAYSAEIASVPLMGVSMQLVLPAELKNNPEKLKTFGYYEDGDRMKASFTSGLEQMFEERIMPVLDKTTLVLEGLQKIINEDSTQNDIKGIIGNLNETSGHIKSISRRLDGVLAKSSNDITASIKSTKELIQNMNETISRLKPILKTYDSLGTNLNETLPGTITAAKTTLLSLNTMLKLMQSDTGSLGKLMNDPELYNNMNEMIVDMNFLVADMQANPHRYVNINVFGKKPIDSDIIKRAKPTKISGPATITIELKRNVPDDLKITFYDMINKKTFELQPADQTTTSFKVSIPGDVGIGTHAIGLEWNRNKDTDYVSVVRK